MNLRLRVLVLGVLSAAMVLSPAVAGQWATGLAVRQGRVLHGVARIGAAARIGPCD